jgi:hypothetical protein
MGDLESGGGERGGGGGQRGRLRMLIFVHGIYLGPDECSLAWMFTGKIC